MKKREAQHSVLMAFAIAVVFWGLAQCLNIITEPGNFIPTESYAILALIFVLAISVVCAIPVIYIFGHPSMWKNKHGETDSSYSPLFGYLMGLLLGFPLFCWVWFTPIMYGVPAYIVKSTGNIDSRIERVSHLYSKTSTRRMPSFGCTNGVTFDTPHIWRLSFGSLCLKHSTFDKLRRGEKLELNGYGGWPGFYISEFRPTKSEPLVNNATVQD